MELVNRTATSQKPSCGNKDIGQSAEVTTTAESEVVANGLLRVR